MDNKKQKIYIDFLFINPKLRNSSKLSKPIRWEEDVDTPEQMVVSTLFSAGTYLTHATNPMVVMSCIPMMAPFRTPALPYDGWCHSKRARAFQRALFLLCSAHGTVALWRFCSGNLIGGFFDTLLAGCGMYASHPDGITFLPQFLMFAAFNGFMDFLQILQALHGVPIMYVFLHPAFIRPLMLSLECYIAWNFHKEITACYLGIPSDGPDDSYFVKCFGSDIWSSLPGGDPISPQPSAGVNVPIEQRPGFNVFGGVGHQLGAN